MDCNIVCIDQRLGYSKWERIKRINSCHIALPLPFSLHATLSIKKDPKFIRSANDWPGISSIGTVLWESSIPAVSIAGGSNSISLWSWIADTEEGVILMVVVLGGGMVKESSEGEVFKRPTPICSMRATAFFMATCCCWRSCQSALSRSFSVVKAQV